MLRIYKNPMIQMAQGLGKLWAEIFREKEKTQILEVLTRIYGEEFVLIAQISDYRTSEEDFCEVHQYCKRLDLIAIAEVLQEILDEEKKYRTLDQDSPFKRESAMSSLMETLKDKGSLIEQITYHLEVMDVQVFISTEEQYLKEKEGFEYAQCERIAQAFAKEKGVREGTLEFLKALDEEIQSIRQKREVWNHYEVRAEEWAANRYVGNSSETYFDDLNYVNSQFKEQRESLEKLYAFLEMKCPLLMCLYREEKLTKSADC